jgi:hypothetical protein
MLAAFTIFVVAIFAFWDFLNRAASQTATMSNNRGSTSESKLIPESLYSITVTDTEFLYTHPDGKQEIVEWTDLEAVDVETTDQGPLLPDVFWVLTGTKSKCVVAQGAAGENALIQRLQALPGFSNERMIAAMASTSNQRFECWKRIAQNA